MADLQSTRDFNKDFVAWVQAEIKAGKTADQAAMEYKVPEQFDEQGRDGVDAAVCSAASRATSTTAGEEIATELQGKDA